MKPLPRSENALFGHLGLANKFVIQYSGNIGRTHGIEYLIQCAEQMRNDSPLHFLFIGFGGKKAWLKQAVEDRGLKNVTILDYRLRSELRYSLNACDIAIISLARGMAGVSVPSRMYNVMAAGKPIIAVADAASELAQVIRDEDIGWVVEPGNVAALKAAIIEAMGNPDRLIQMGLRARRAAETKYSFERANASYINLVYSLYQQKAIGVGKPIVLVTGANGFLGSEVVWFLCAESLTARATGLENTMFSSGHGLLSGHMSSEKEQVRPVVAGVSIIVHTAGLT